MITVNLSPHLNPYSIDKIVQVLSQMVCPDLKITGVDILTADIQETVYTLMARGIVAKIRASFHNNGGPTEYRVEIQFLGIEDYERLLEQNKDKFAKLGYILEKV